MNNEKSIKFLENLDSHLVYKPPYIVTELNKCGFAAQEMFKGNGIVVNGMRIETKIPEWGESGIYSLDVLATIYQLIIHELPISEMQGRGFWYRDVLGQLKGRLGIQTDEDS